MYLRKGTKMKLNGMIAKAIKSEQDYQETKRADWQFTKKALRGMLEDLFPEGTKIWVGAGSITIRVPWGVDNIRQARKAMGSGWKFSSNYTETSGTLTKTYYMYDVSVPTDSYRHTAYVCVSLIMDASELNPETCKKIEIGEKTFTQKVYKIVCDDGVQEMLGAAEELDSDDKVKI
jgi:hypothetical protein